MITQERLKEVLNYDPETGLFTWLVRTAQRVKIGNVAGYLDPDGYKQIRIDNELYRSHRLAFLYMTGKLPEIHVDHIDGIRHNNKWLNLRECNDSQNGQNQKKAQKGNKSGLLGVSPSSNNNGTFCAQITINGKNKRIGTFKTKEEAHRAYLEEKRKIHEFNML